MRDERSLWDAVLAAPDDPAPRLVLADALLERDEPYGEFLARSNRSDRAARRGLASLRDGCTPGFLGPLAEVTSSRRVWRDGLLDGIATVPADLAAFEAAAGHPAWGTVRTLTVSGRMDGRVAPSIQWLAEFRGWRWLEEVRLNAPAHYQALAPHADLPIQRLQVGFCWPSDARGLGSPDQFPALREVQLDTVPMAGDDAELAMRAFLSRPLDCVGFGLHPATIASWVERCGDAAIHTLRLSDETWCLETEVGTWEWRAKPLRKAARESTVHGLLRRVDRAHHRGVQFIR